MKKYQKCKFSQNKYFSIQFYIIHFRQLVREKKIGTGTKLFHTSYNASAKLLEGKILAQPRHVHRNGKNIKPYKGYSNKSSIFCGENTQKKKNKES